MNTQTWLHFIGKQYYTQSSFTKEARRYDITRRVSVKQLEKMHYGDRVLLAMVDGASAVAFGSFIISTISGLSAEAAAVIAAKFELVQVDIGGASVQRGCGSYVTGGTYAVKGADLPEIVAALKDVANPGKLMVGGKFEQTPDPTVRLKDIRHQQGFRAFDWGGFLADVASADAKHPVVRGHFYADATTKLEQALAEDAFYAQVVVDYKRKDG